MRVKFSIHGKETLTVIESDDLKDLVHKVESEVLRLVSESNAKVKSEQYLISQICEAICCDADSEEIDLGELAR